MIYHAHARMRARDIRDVRGASALIKEAGGIQQGLRTRRGAERNRARISLDDEACVTSNSWTDTRSPTALFGEMRSPRRISRLQLLDCYSPLARAISIDFAHTGSNRLSEAYLQKKNNKREIVARDRDLADLRITIIKSGIKSGISDES